MPRAIVTSGLTETLRSIRLQNKIQAKQLAAHIKKSPAYISRLENGGIHTIDTKELYSILEFISGKESSSDLADHIYKSLQLKYSVKEIEDQLWFTNYETVECQLPIPESLVDNLNLRIKDLNITREYLCRRINANEALTEEEIKDNSLPINQWYHYSLKSDTTHSIKIHLAERQLDDILDKHLDSAPYVFVMCILFYLLKIEKYHKTVNISESEYKDLLEKANSILNSYKFISISEKNRLLSEKQTYEEMTETLNSFDKENLYIVNDIINGFQFAAEHNIKIANTQLKSFSENMHWDLGFMLKLCSLDFKELDKTSVSNKRKLLADIDILLKKYSDLPDDSNVLETY